MSGSPTRWSSGTQTSSKKSSRVSRPFQPMPRIFGPIVKPGVSFSTTSVAYRGAVSLARFGAGEQRHAERHVGARVRDERLRPVDQPAAVAPLRLRADAARVGAGVGLGQTERAQDAPFGQRPQPALALRVVAEQVAAAASRSSRAPATPRRPTGRPGRSAPSPPRSRRSTCRSRPTPRARACRAVPARPSPGAGRSGTAPPPTPPARAARSRAGRSRDTGSRGRVRTR